MSFTVLLSVWAISLVCGLFGSCGQVCEDKIFWGFSLDKVVVVCLVYVVISGIGWYLLCLWVFKLYVSSVVCLVCLVEFGKTNAFAVFSMIRELWYVWSMWSCLSQDVIHCALECLYHKVRLWSVWSMWSCLSQHAIQCALQCLLHKLVLWSVWSMRLGLV